MTSKISEHDNVSISKIRDGYTIYITNMGTRYFPDKDGLMKYLGDMLD